MTLEDMPQSVCEALCTRLDEGSASLGELTEAALTAGLRGHLTGLVESWLDKQRGAGFIELTNGRWQVR